MDRTAHKNAYYELVDRLLDKMLLDGEIKDPQRVLAWSLQDCFDYLMNKKKFNEIKS